MQPALNEHPAADKHTSTPQQKSQVISKLIWAGPYMMNLQDVMVNDALKYIEKPPTDKQGADK